MKKEQETVTYFGGCHCGAVRFQVIVNEHEALECNCSICEKKGFLHLLVSADKFVLLKGQEMLTTYSFNTHLAKHTFCRLCGIHSFYYPRSHPQGVDVNIRCLDGNVIPRFNVKFFDGANWEENVDEIR